MAIQWSASNRHFLVGLDVSMSPATVTAVTSQVTLTWAVYVKTDPSWYVNENLTVTLTGGVSAKLAYHLVDSKGGVQFLAGTRTQTVATSYAAAVVASVKATVGDVSTGAAPSVTASFSVPKRPASAAPSAPTTVSASYVSDKQVNVSWTRPASASSASSAWASTMVQRQTNGGAWVTVAQLTGTGSSWSDTSVVTNSAYVYRVAGVNQSGTSAYATSAAVATTPAAPTSVQAQRNGSSVTVTWTSKSPAGATFDVQNGSAVVASGVSGSSVSLANVDLSTAHTYWVRAVVGGRTSLWSSPSNTIIAACPPAVPSNLNPPVAATGQSAWLTWKHNPIDTTEQSAFQIRFSTDGGATWSDPVSQTSTDSYYDASSYAQQAGTFQWQVRTAGLYQGDSPWSPWSAAATVGVSTAPVVAIQTPDATVGGSSSPITWTYFQAEGLPQVAWKVAVVDLTAGSITRAAASGQDGTTSVDSGNVFDNGGSYYVFVQSQSSSGIWSNIGMQQVHVSYTPPLPALVNVDPHLDRGFVEVVVTAQNDGKAPDTVDLLIERRTESGAWVTLAANVGLNTDVIDWTPSIGEVNHYRITSISALPSTNVVTVDVDPAGAGIADPTVLLSGGPGFGMTIRFSAASAADLTTTRERTLNQFAGRTRQVETTGIHIERSISVTANLVTYSTDPAEATRESVQQLFEMPGPHLYRDSLGRFMFVSLSSVTVPAAWVGQVQFTCTEIDPGTVEQQNSISAYTGPTLVEVLPGEYTVLGGSALEVNPGEFMWQGDQVRTLGA